MYYHMHKLLYDYHVIQADETPCLVNRDGRPAGAKSYMWVYRSSCMYPEEQIVLYDYQKTRNVSHPREFLKDYNGICVTDGYQVYHSLEKEQEYLKIAGCWVHYPKSMIIRADSLRTSLTVHFQKYYSDNLCSLFSIQKIRYCSSLFIWNITIMKPFIIPFF